MIPSANQQAPSSFEAFLEQDLHKELLRFTTAGSVDDGEYGSEKENRQQYVSGAAIGKLHVSPSGAVGATQGVASDGG